AKLKNKMIHNKEESVAQIKPIFKEVQPKHEYSTQPIVQLNHRKKSDYYVDASKQVQSGLEAVDLGLPSTLNKQLMMMSSRYVKPINYTSTIPTDESQPQGYMGAMMMNLARQRDSYQSYVVNRLVSSFEKNSTVEELKNRRNKISLDYNYFLKKIGDLELKKAVADLAVDLTDEKYYFINDDVFSNLPARIDTMVN
ncbi:MAG: hypothetical protein ACK559_17130, partial [bacterium]